MSGLEGSFAEGVERDHAGHLRTGSFANFDCPKCRDAISTHLEHERRATGSFAGQVATDEEGHPTQVGSFATVDCPICNAYAG